MGFLDDIMADDVKFGFADLDGFAEPVVYKNRIGIKRTVPAIVDRNPPVIADGGQRVAPKMVLQIPNASGTNGILATELDTGGDKIVVAYVKGGEAKEYAIRLPEGGVRHDVGMIFIELN